MEIFAEDFANGSYRIKRPGRYILMEDIRFEPCSNLKKNKRKDMPRMGWFCVISIEADNVTLDLNDRTIEFDKKFIEKNIITFGNSHMSIICLNNCPLNNKIMNYYYGYSDDIVYDICRDPIDYKFTKSDNVCIKNGCIKTSPKNIINGYYNECVTIENVYISNFETCGICLFSGNYITIKHCDIQGLSSEQKQLTKPMQSELIVAFVTLQENRWSKISLQKYNNVDNHLNTIRSLLSNYVEHNLAKDGYSPTNVQGIYIGTLLLEKTIFGKPSDNIKKIKNITIENVRISDIKVDAKVVEGIRDKKNNLLISGGGLGIIRWSDVFSNNMFKPNKLSQALAYNMLSFSYKSLSEEYVKILKSIIYKNEQLFNQTYFREKVFLTNCGFPGGSHGIKIDNGQDILIRNCEICYFENIGKIPTGCKLEKTKIPTGCKLEKTNCNVYEGNDIAAIGLNNVLLESVTIENIKVHDFFTKHGKKSSLQLTLCSGKNDMHCRI